MMEGEIQLLYFDSDTISGYFSNRDSFIHEFKIKKVHEDTLYYQTVFEVNRCQMIDPQIYVRNDSILFDVVELDSNQCAAIKLVKVSYLICNYKSKYVLFDAHR